LGKGLLELWEIIGVSILAGPLILTNICLAICMIHTGIEEWLGKAPEPAYEMEIDLKRYIQDVKALIDSLKPK